MDLAIAKEKTPLSIFRELELVMCVCVCVCVCVDEERVRYFPLPSG